MTLKQTAGFTLLEVMVAVVILAVGLSSLFTSQVGAIRIAQRARMTGVASLLVRCKMAEVEERILKEGWPGSTLEGRDECCEDAEHEGFSCEYKVERIVLPDQMGGEDEEGNPLKAALGQEGTAGGASAGGLDPASAIGIPLNGPLGALSGLGGAAGGGAAGGGGGGDPLESMVMEFTFPIMKPLIEEQVRRVTVTVSWKEGSSAQNLAVVQFVVNELPMVVPDDEDADDPAGGTGGGTTTGGGGTTSGGGTGTKQ